MPPRAFVVYQDEPVAAAAKRRHADATTVSTSTSGSATAVKTNGESEHEVQCILLAEVGSKCYDLTVMPLTEVSEAFEVRVSFGTISTENKVQMTRDRSLERCMSGSFAPTWFAKGTTPSFYEDRSLERCMSGSSAPTWFARGTTPSFYESPECGMSGSFTAASLIRGTTPSSYGVEMTHDQSLKRGMSGSFAPASFVRGTTPSFYECYFSWPLPDLKRNRAPNQQIWRMNQSPNCGISSSESFTAALLIKGTTPSSYEVRLMRSPERGMSLCPFI